MWLTPQWPKEVMIKAVKQMCSLAIIGAWQHYRVFCIASEHREKGVASGLAERLYTDVYPFGHNAGHSYHGPMSMYKKNGFQKSGKSVH